MASKKATRPGSKRKTKPSADSPSKEPHSPEVSTLSGVMGKKQPSRPVKGTGPAAAGQSGALQGLSRNPDADSQSVEELIEEGQTHEADVISGVENAPDADQGEVRTHGDKE